MEIHDNWMMNITNCYLLENMSSLMLNT